MHEITLTHVETAVRAMAETALANENHFSDLDGACGDGDFGTSLATGFRVVLAQWETIDRSSIAAFLQKIGIIITSHVGGCSGPIWGTGFLRAAGVARGKAVLTLPDLVAMAQAAMQGMMARGGAQLGDKTLLDALAPATDRLAAGGDILAAWDDATAAATAAIEATRPWTARRGRQSFTGDRSQGTLDPGIVGVATMMQAIGAALRPVSSSVTPSPAPP
jgi:dihydroxyacetone kinase phosphoprotein-dependent L subunit